jgi:hypothetical protein
MSELFNKIIIVILLLLLIGCVHSHQQYNYIDRYKDYSHQLRIYTLKTNPSQIILYGVDDEFNNTIFPGLNSLSTIKYVQLENNILIVVLHDDLDFQSNTGDEINNIVEHYMLMEETYQLTH